MLKRFSEISMEDVTTCGGKGASLGEMMDAGLPIPNGFVLTTNAYGKESTERENDVLQAFDKLNTKFVAVRSSGTKEDGVDDSFAGQFDTYLFVTRENLIEKIRECHDSVNSERIISYCDYKGIDRKSIKVAVVVQKMVNSDSAGVCFTVNPVSQDHDEIMIDAGFGVGEAVVSGMITPDNYIINKKTGKIKKNISQQEKKLVLSDKGGTEEVKISVNEQSKQKLSDENIKRLSELAIKIEKHYGKPMDTEWAVENGELFMLQARPITTLNETKSKVKKYTIYPAGDFNTSFISNYSVVLGYTKYPELLGLPICDGPHVVRNGDLEYIFDMSTRDDYENEIIKNMDKDINYIDKLINDMMAQGKSLCEWIRSTIETSDIKKLNNKEILNILEKFIEYQSNLYAYGTSLNFIGYGEDNYITKNLYKIFGEKNIPEGKINEVMEIFTYPYKESFSQIQENEILELIKKYTNKYKKDFVSDCKLNTLDYIEKKYPDFYEELEKHSKKYSRLGFGFTGPSSTVSDFFNDIKKILEDKISVDEKLENIKSKKLNIEKEKKLWIEKMQPNSYEKLLLETAGKIVWAKPTRKDYQSQAYCFLEPIILEISNRLQVDKDFVWQMSISNIKKFLEGKLDIKQQTEFQNFYICVPEGLKNVEVLSGEIAHEFYDDNVFIEKDKIEVQDNLIYGNTACKGSAKGIVKIINSKSDMSKMEPGNILVSVATSPSIVSAMKKAAGIITDSGGLTCHAAIVSRELGIPCVIGTKIATQVLKDGDLVEVDADNGIVKILENGEKDNLKIEILGKVYTPNFWEKPEVFFNYQGVPFYTSVFAKCYSLPESNRSTPAYYVSEFKEGGTIIQYCAGNFVEKGYNIINDLLEGKTEGGKFLAENDKRIVDCFEKCKEYINSNETNFLDIWRQIENAFANGWHIFNFSHALQDYLNKLKENDINLYQILSNNIVAPEKTFINKAGDYLKELVDKYPNDFNIVYENFMKEYGRFQNSYLGVNKNITKKWLKNYYESLLESKNNESEKVSVTNIPEKYKSLVDVAGKAIIYQDNKKKLGLIAYEIMDKRLLSIAKKTGITFEDLLRLTVDEILSYNLDSEDSINELKKKLSKYKNSGVRRGIMIDNGYIDIDKEFWDKVVEINSIKSELNEIKGIVGNKGKIVGRAKIVLSIKKDGYKLESGDILVTGMTRPEFLPLMQKASAFITDEGGITCHAAIVSRELGKPCIIGTKIATQVLKDGDLVEVDADNGVVRILESDTKNHGDILKKFNELKEYKQRDIQTFNSYPFFINCVATVSAFNLLPYNLHYTQILCEYKNSIVKWHYDTKDYENLGKIFWEKCKNTEEILKLIKKYNDDYKKSDENFEKSLSNYKKNRTGESRILLLKDSVQLLAHGAGAAHILECASYYAEKYLTKGKLITPHGESFLSKAHKLAKKLKSENSIQISYKKFLKEYGRIKNTYLGKNTISLQEFSDLANENDLKFTNPKYEKDSIEEIISYIFNWQDNRKENIFRAIEKVDDVLIQIAKDINVDKKTLCYMLPNEVLKIENKEFQDELKKRELYFIDYTTNNDYYSMSGVENQCVDGLRVKQDSKGISEIKGSIGNPGKATGIVHVCQSLGSIKNFKEGGVLVTSMTRPEFIPAMRKASAFVTDEGGITCHAAIISRELGKPCIIGTKIATQVLKDGDSVEVDADNGIVRILEARNRNQTDVSNENSKLVKINKFSVDEFVYSMGKGKESDIKVIEDFLNNSDWDVQRFNASPVFVNPTGMGNNYIFQKYFGISYSGFFFNYRGQQWEMGYNLKDFDRLREKLGYSYLHTGFVEKVAKDYYDTFSYFEKFFEKIDNGLKIDENNIIKLLKMVNRAQCYSVGIAHSTELINYICTYKLKPLLEKEIGEENLKEIENKIFVADKLSFFAVEHNELYKIAIMKKGEKQGKKLIEHTKKWNRMQNSYVGAKNVDVEFFENRMEKVLQEGEIQLDVEQRDKLIDSLMISDEYKNIIRLINFTTSWHDNRKANILRTIGYFDCILKKLSLISKISFDDLLYLSFSDIDGLNDLKGLIGMKEELKQRRKGVIYVLNDLKEYIFTKDDYLKLNGILESLYAEQNAKEIKGSTANKGIVKGKVRICNSMEKIKEFKEGEILVASMTRPEYISAIKKSIAIITDEGGITCHAAIVSRELGKPCIIGTKIATQVLKDGDLVEVDADKGVVKILESGKENDLKVQIGDKSFTPEFWSRYDNIHFSYQGVPFFSCIFSKCCTTKDTKWTTPANYVCEFNNLENVTQYVIGDFVGKGEKMIDNMLQGKNEASEFLKKQDDIVRDCIKKCEAYIKESRTDFLSIWNEIQIAFEAGCHVINLSYALQKFLENLKRDNQKLYKQISENITAPKKSFVNEADEYLKQLLLKYPGDFERVYKTFMEKYGRFQNSYLGINHIDMDWLKKYSENLLNTSTTKKIKDKKTIDDKYSILIETASDAIIYQDNKKKLGFISMQIMENRLRSYAKLNDIQYKDLTWLTVGEILDNDIKKIKVKIREYKSMGKRWGIMTEKGYSDISEEFWRKVVELNKPKNNIKSFHGITGCKGKYIGNVKIISNMENDKNKFEKGDILVTGMTRPEFIPLLKMSGGIITNEGGITCHAAIISRELGKPCIIGTKIATQVLKDGDLVEVDADNGIVRIL